MTKKLLLTTALITTIAAATSANAKIYEITYTGNNNFGVTVHDAGVAAPSVNYNLQTLLAASASIVPAPGDAYDIKVPRTQLLEDLADNKSGLRDQFAAIVATAQGRSQAEVAQALDTLSAKFKTLPSDVQNRLLRRIDISELARGNLAQVKKIYEELTVGTDYLSKSEQTANIKPKRIAVYNAVVAQDPTAKKLAEEAKKLEALPAMTAAQAAQLEEIEEKLQNIVLSSKSFTELRKSKENQEDLKQRIALVQKSLADATLSNLRLVKDDLEALRENISVYLVKDIKNKSNITVSDLPEVQKPDDKASSSLLYSLNTTRNVVDSRVGGFSGAASGDLMQTYGVWGQGSLSRGTQKAYGFASGYKFDQKGITIGADTGDETLLGAAYSFFANDIKDKDNSSNKEDVKSHIFTIYGKFDITNEAFLTGQAQYGTSSIKKKRVTGDLANNIANGKTNASTAALKLEVGYDYEAAPQIHLVPAVGVSHANVHVKSYKESGIGLNRTVGARTATRTSGLASITAKYVVDMEQVKLIPEVHANIDYALSAKNSDTSVTVIDGLAPIATPSEKISKGFYTIGGSVKAIHSSMYEISGGLDLGLAKKFQSTTGTLKLRVNL